MMITDDTTIINSLFLLSLCFLLELKLFFLTVKVQEKCLLFGFIMGISDFIWNSLQTKSYWRLRHICSQGKGACFLCRIFLYESVIKFITSLINLQFSSFKINHSSFSKFDFSKYVVRLFFSMIKEIINWHMSTNLIN